LQVVLDAGALSEEQKVPVRKHHKGGPSQEKEEALWKKVFGSIDRSFFMHAPGVCLMCLSLLAAV